MDLTHAHWTKINFLVNLPTNIFGHEFWFSFSQVIIASRGTFLQNKSAFNIVQDWSIFMIHFHYSTVESDLLNSLAWDIFYILSSTVGYKISTMGYKLYTLSTVGYKLYTLSTMGYKLLYPIVDKKYPTLSY